MKQIIFIAMSLIAFINVSFAQKITPDNLPPAVADAFKARFPKAEKVSWDMDYDAYEAEFKLNKTDVSAKYDKDGNWMETETPLTLSGLPAAVKTTLNKTFDPLKDPLKEDGISKLEKPEGTTYEIDGQNNGVSYIIVISDKGDLIKKEEVKTKKEEEKK